MSLHPALPESFTRRITVLNNGCWAWSSFGPHGYGTYKAATGITYRAHRFAYLAVVGPIPDGLVLDHLCRVRHCVNPAHLEPVTQRENSLRGVGPAARNAIKTHCENGHPFDERNTYIRPATGNRFCKACRAECAARRRARERAEASLKAAS